MFSDLAGFQIYARRNRLSGKSVEDTMFLSENMKNHYAEVKCTENKDNDEFCDLVLLIEPLNLDGLSSQESDRLIHDYELINLSYS